MFRNADVSASSSPRIRPMEGHEVDLAIEWAATERWNPGLHDARCFHAADPEGFLLAELNGEPLGCISAVRYGSEFGFLGLYIMRPEYRGRGYGLALWQEAMRHLQGRNIGLDGVVAQQDNYRKSGFHLAHRNVRYERSSPPLAGATSTPLPLPAGTTILPLDAVPFHELLHYDTQHFGFPREAFLRCWISRPSHRTAALLEDDRLSGYAVLRSCRQGHKIGPLFADREDGAELLFQHLAATADGPLYLDVPQINEAAVRLAERHGMTPVFETARMYTEGDPGLPLHHIYGITTFELG